MSQFYSFYEMRQKKVVELSGMERGADRYRQIHAGCVCRWSVPTEITQVLGATRGPHAGWEEHQ